MNKHRGEDSVGNLPTTVFPWTYVLVGIAVVAVALRLGSALYQGDSVQALPGIHDQISYDSLARRVLGGYGFTFAEDHWPATRAGEPTAHWSFLYTSYLSGIYGLFGPRPVVARILQAVIAGILQVWLTWRIGARIFGEIPGVVAAGLAAVYLYFVYYAGALITETFYIIGVLWTLDCLLRLVERAGSSQRTAGTSPRIWPLWIELGLALGITILLRQLFLLLVPFLYLWLWWSVNRVEADEASDHNGRLWSLTSGSLLSLIIVLCMIVPFTLRNYRAFHMFVPLNTNSGYALFWGNHPHHGTDFVAILPEGGPTYVDLIPPELLDLSEAELDSALLREGVGFIVNDPLRYMLLSVSRVREYFKFWPSPQSGPISNMARVASFGLFLPFMLYGLWIALRLIRNPQDFLQRSAILLLLGYCILYTGIHLLTWTLIRYRIPVDAVLVIFAAVGIVDLWWRVRGQTGGYFREITTSSTSV